MTPTEFLAQLQEEAGKTGFHKELRAWVDDQSSVARALMQLEERQDADGHKHDEYGVQRTLPQWNGGEPYMEWNASVGMSHRYEYTAESVFGLADGNPVFKRTRTTYDDKVSEPVQVSRKDAKA